MLPKMPERASFVVRVVIVVGWRWGVVQGMEVCLREIG